ncbi:MAG: hypothetical protein JXQ72_03550, partial [Anaerolineae bacterium]|nr:hypothetical protein [Anaerolineae bacterium]
MTDDHFDTNDQYDQYADYEDDFDPMQTSRAARRKRKPRVNPKSRQRQQAEIVDEIADAVALEAGFETTYQPSKHEAGWLLQSLQSLYDQQMITDVLALVKGGKEASVYRCAAHESTGETMLAAKVYRPRMFRQLRNDHAYRQGRQVIAADGPAINASDFREMRALAKGTEFGRRLQHTSWLMHEYTTMGDLYAAGAAVPKPYAVGDNVILMEYIGDESLAGPTLNSVRLDSDEVEPLFDTVIHTVRLLMERGWVHGDLSAYNILYWDGAITVIDFPQVTSIASNPSAYTILERDLTRICDYFADQGLKRDPQHLTLDLWRRYAGRTPLELAEDLAPFVEAEIEE